MRKMAFFRNRLLSSWGDTLCGVPLILQKQPSTPYNGFQGQRSFAASSKGKGLERGKVQKISNKAEAPEEEPKKKGGMNAYSLFMKQSGPAILAKHKTSTLAERSQVLAAAWNKLSEVEKATYTAQIVVGSSKPPATLPRTVYQLFLRQSGSDIMAKHPKLKNIGERSKLLAAEWKKVPAEEKERLAAELQKITPARAKKKVGPSSNYTNFVKENYQRVSAKMPNQKASEVIRELASVWKTLSDSQKASYSK